MKVYIIRHGETNWNVKGLLQGKSDTHLNETGRQQALKIANRLRLEKIDIIISSPLSRALDTAKIIGQYHPKAELLTEENLAEVSFGDMEGLTHQQIVEKYGVKKFTPHEEFCSIAPNGESLEQRVEKLIPVIEKWKKNYQNKNILLSTHGFIKKGLLIAFKITSMEELNGIRFENTALTIIKPFDIPNIELFNDSSHLD